LAVNTQIPCFFHSAQLKFKPRYEWAFGEKIDHPETTARAEGILAAIESDPARYDLRKPEVLDESLLLEIHEEPLLRMLETSENLRRADTFYPAVFMRGEGIRSDPGKIAHAGSFCFDSGTPLSRETWSAARWSAACAISAARLVRSGSAPLAYALSRPPGHHATSALFGGYCYLANSALAAKLLSAGGARVAVLDIDVHHGNGTQAIFWNDPRVLTISIHGDPSNFFPFFTGFASETGGVLAPSFNLNVPLPERTDIAMYEEALDELVFPRLDAFAPDFLVLAAGVDTYERDPMGCFSLTTQDLHRIGERIGHRKHPTVVVQEGGYYTPHIGRNVTALLSGLREGRGAPHAR
jgi:acetoin utilization deacetylase AcuC-like enzyme